MIFFIIFLIICCTILGIVAIINTIRLNTLKQKAKKRIYYTPKLSSLHRKDFATYMEYLVRDLY